MNPEQNQTHFKTDSRPMRYSWAPGGYIHTCPTCKEGFVGDKRAQICADCAYALPDPTPTEQNQETRGKYRISQTGVSLFLIYNGNEFFASTSTQSAATQIIDALNSVEQMKGMKLLKPHEAEFPKCPECGSDKQLHKFGCRANRMTDAEIEDWNQESEQKKEYLSIERRLKRLFICARLEQLPRGVIEDLTAIKAELEQLKSERDDLKKSIALIHDLDGKTMNGMQEEINNLKAERDRLKIQNECSMDLVQLCFSREFDGKKLVTLLEDGETSHRQWAEHFEKNPELESQYVATNEWDSAKTHRQYEQAYKELIAALKLLQSGKPSDLRTQLSQAQAAVELHAKNDAQNAAI